MNSVRLAPYLRPGLDVLFVALNPSAQSNGNGHYFSGRQSRFFRLLALSGLTTRELDRSRADEQAFGGNEYNYNEAQFGVCDLVEEIVETDSSRIRPAAAHVERLIERIRRHEPRMVCAIHGKIRDTLNGSRHPELTGRLDYGRCGRLLRGSRTEFFLNYFPNGNAIPDAGKLAIFAELKSLL